MDIIAIPRVAGAMLFRPTPHSDSRGFFSRTFDAAIVRSAGIDPDAFVQDSVSRSARGVLRGLHLRSGRGESKLVRCSYGAIFDIIVDLRPGSSTYGNWESFELRDSEQVSLYVPAGCAHGFQALTQPADVSYRIDREHNPSEDVAIAHDDPDLKIPWPLPVTIMSERDRKAPFLRDQGFMLYNTSTFPIMFRSMTTISVIITVYGVADYLDRCLDSILNQEGAESMVELIAVDDASPDRSGAILATRQDPRLRVIRSATTAGPGRARELGMKEATGEYLWFVDADDELADGALAEVTAKLDRLHPDVLVIDYENIYANGSVTPSGADLSTPEVTALADSPVLLDITSSMWNKVVRRDFLAGLGMPFGPGIYEDVPVALGCLLMAFRIGVLDRVCYRYRRSRNGSFMAEVSDRHFDMFRTYETIYAFVSERFPEALTGTSSVYDARSAQTAHASRITAHVRTALFARTIRHYVFALQKVPGSNRRDFFGQMTRDFRRWQPEEFTFPAGPRGVELRLIGRGAYRAYCALIPLNRFRLALRQRLR